MRIMLQAKLPNAEFNALVKAGTAGQKLKKVLDELKPQAVYFTDMDGQRCAIAIVDLPDASKIPTLAEPWFMTFNAEIALRIIMSPEDLAKAGLDDLGKKWA